VAVNCESVMERLQRSEVSNPPAFGAKVASMILNDDKLTKMWYADLVTMCSRIRRMREALYNLLVQNGMWPNRFGKKRCADLSRSSGRLESRC